MTISTPMTISVCPTIEQEGDDCLCPYWPYESEDSPYVFPMLTPDGGQRRRRLTWLVARAPGTTMDQLYRRTGGQFAKLCETEPLQIHFKCGISEYKHGEEYGAWELRSATKYGLQGGHKDMGKCPTCKWPMGPSGHIAGEPCPDILEYRAMQKAGFSVADLAAFYGRSVTYLNARGVR